MDKIEFSFKLKTQPGRASWNEVEIQISENEKDITFFPTDRRKKWSNGVLEYWNFHYSNNPSILNMDERNIENKLVDVVFIYA